MVRASAWLLPVGAYPLYIGGHRAAISRSPVEQIVRCRAGRRFRIRFCRIHILIREAFVTLIRQRSNNQQSEPSETWPRETSLASERGRGIWHFHKHSMFGKGSD